MSEISDYMYSSRKAFKSIGKKFWARYKDDLLAFAKDQTKTEIPKRIHAGWDGLFHWPSGTDRRIEWAVALYEHGDWPGLSKSHQESAEDTEGHKTLPSSQTIEHTAVSPQRPTYPTTGQKKPARKPSSTTNAQATTTKTNTKNAPTVSPTEQKNKAPIPTTSSSKTKSRKRRSAAQSSATTQTKRTSSIKKKCSNCRFSKNPDMYCPHGMFGPCDEWVEATPVEEYWPTWEDMKRAERDDYKNRYREY